MKTTRIALSIRAQLLLVLTVFLALPWLGVEYVRELERVLRDAQERTLAGTAQAVATALHDRPRLFANPADPIASFARERTVDTTRGSPSLPPSASPEIAQIIEGLSRTTARIWVIDRDGTVLARAGTLKTVPAQVPPDTLWQRIGRSTIGRLYALVLEQPTEDFSDDAATQGAPRGKDVEGALAGILTTERHPTSDGKATVVSAAHPIWVGDQVRGVVIAEETGNGVLAQRNLAFERLFNIVLAVLLIGSLALTGYATWLSSRIRRLRDDAERAIDEQGRVREPLASSDAGDEIGDLSRSFSSVLARLSDYASYQEKMASRLSHELRTPVAVVRSVVLDYKNYPSFISRFEKARVVGRSGDKTDVYLQVPILKGAAKVWAIVRFEPVAQVNGGEVIVGHMIKGNVKRLDATWRLRKIDEASTRVALELLIVPDMPVPGSLVVPEVRFAAAKAVEGSRDESEKRRPR